MSAFLFFYDKIWKTQKTKLGLTISKTNIRVNDQKWRNWLGLRISKRDFCKKSIKLKFCHGPKPFFGELDKMAKLDFENKSGKRFGLPETGTKTIKNNRFSRAHWPFYRQNAAFWIKNFKKTTFFKRKRGRRSRPAWAPRWK